MAARLLAMQEHEVKTVTNGRAALAAVREARYDVVLMDVQMPEMDGLEATRRIRAECKADAQPHVIALTAAVTPEDRQQCREAGADDFLSKPLKRDDLFEALSRASNAAE